MKGLSLLVVGGGSGLGAEVAATAVQQGVGALGIIDVNEEGAERALEPARQAGLPTVSAVADIRTAGAAHDAFAYVVEALDRIDTVVNCAAVYPRRPLLEITDEEWDTSNAINVKGTYHIMVAAVRHMCGLEPQDNIRGRIVNISSVDAFKAHPRNAHYAATKAAVVSLTRSFAHEFAGEGILVNSVAPAGIATEKAKAAGFLGELAAANPLGRAAEPREMVEWVLMAGSRRNTYMTGENIIVSGGYIYA